jgi:hypothetical protein
VKEVFVSIDIAAVATLITITATTIYVLGLLALGYPVYSRITKNSSTALYVVSVVPRTVVAGHGVRFLLGIPLIWTLLFAAFLSVPQLVSKSFDVRSSYVEDPILNQTIMTLLNELPVIIAIFIALGFLGLHEILSAAGLYNIFYPYSSLRSLAGGENPRPASIADPVDPQDYAGERGLREFFAPSLVIANAIGCIGGAVGGVILAIEGWSWETLFVALVFVIVINFVANVLAVVSIKPPMPKVKVSREGTDESKPIKGYLLAHSEGLWYIFDEECTVLQTIRDDTAVIDVFYP